MPSAKNPRGVPRQAKSSKTPSEKGFAAKTAVENPDPSIQASSELQQKCLDIFRDALNPSAEDAAVLQEVKGHLYRRDFATAFGKDEYLRVYASRWSPSRALCYLQVFNDLEALPSMALESTRQPKPLQMAFLGGGAGGELVAAGAWLSQLKASMVEGLSSSVDLKLVDIADWSTIVSALGNGIKTPPTLSKYASQAKKNANTALLEPRNLSVDYQRADVLSMDESNLTDLVRNVNLIAIMFTLNELYATSMAKTQQLLLRLKSHAAPGALFLVVDSPGSYSTVSINGTEKKYPMEWLLHHTMLGDSTGEQGKDWMKEFSDSSRWFRLPNGLQYPVELENMRFQIHLFRKPHSP